MMRAFETMASGDLLLRVAELLLGAGVRGILLLALVLGAARLLRGASAATRHALVGAGVVVALLLPVAGLLPWRLPVLPNPALFPVVQVPSAGLPAPTRLLDQYRLQVVEQPGVEVVRETSRTSTGISSNPSIEERLEAARGMSGAAWASILWLLGASLLALRVIASGWRARRLLRSAEAVTEEEWTEVLWESADRLDVGADVRLLRTAAVDIPFTMGVVRPAIVLPSAADGWDEERRRAVLMHELAHIRRRDVLLHHASRWACTLYWFNPLIWLAAGRLRAESERAADDLVLSIGTRPSEYADHLLQIVSGLRPATVPGAVLPLARRREFEGRLIAILEPHLHRSAPTRRETAFLIAAIAVLAVPLAALSPVRTEATEPASGSAGADAESLATAYAGAVDFQDARTPDPVQADTPVLGTAPSVVTEVQQLVDVQLERTITEIDARVAIVDVLADADPEEDPRIIAALIRILETDPEPEVRLAAIRALAEFEAFEAVDPLSNILRNDADPSVRAYAARALADIEDGRAVDDLAAAVQDSDPRVRRAALTALEDFDAPIAVDALLRAVSDPDPITRRRAASLLADIDLEVAPPELVASLADPDPEVRVAAALALAEIEDPTTAAALGVALADSVEAVRAAAFEALIEMDSPEAIEPLIRALQDPDPIIRQRAAEALGDL